MTQPARARVEVFSRPCLFDDHFVKWWTTGAANISTDGDIATISCVATGDYERTYTFSATQNTNPNRYLTVKATGLTGTSWAVKIYMDTTLKVSKSYTTTDIKEIDLYTEFGAHFDYNKVSIWVSGTADQHVKVDYIVIGDAPMLVPTTTNDVIDELTVTLPTISRGISGARMKIFNPDGELTGKVDKHDAILVYIWRDGGSQKKVFGGRVIAPGTDSSLDRNEYYITIDAHDHGWELHKPPALVEGFYTSVNGKTIIEGAVDKCVYLTKKFVDVDNDIASQHDVEFNEVTPGSVIDDIIKSAQDSAGAVGLDGYVDPAGNMNIFKRGKYTSDVTIIPLSYRQSEDIHRIVNKQKIGRAHV